MTSALLAVVLVALLAAVSFGVGGALLGRVRSWHGGAGERTVFAVALGLGAIAYLVLALGLLGLLRPGVLAGAVVGLAALSAGRTLPRRRAAASARPEREPAASARPLWTLAAVTALALLGLFTLVAALAPPAGLEWDTLSYHLAGPKTYLREGRIFYIPYDHHTNFPFTLQMLYTGMLAFGSVGGAKLVHWLCGALLVASVYTFGVRHLGPAGRGRAVGLVAALIVAATPIVLWEASVAYVDLATALFTWLSVYALFNAAQAALTPVPFPGVVGPFPTPGAVGEGCLLRGSSSASRQAVAEPGNRHPSPTAPGVGKGPTTPGKGTGVRADSIPWLVTSAVLMGFALGTKMTVLGFWGMLLVGVLAWHFVTTGKWAKQSVPHALLWGGVSLLVGAPWYVKSWLYTDNPVYPFYFNLFGGRYWNAQNAAGYAADQAHFGFGKSALDLLLGPWQATMEASLLPPGRPFVFTEYVIFGLSPVYVGLLVAAPLLVRRLSRTGVLLALFGLGVLGFWFFLMQQTRYLIPALPAFALVGAEVVVTACGERRPSGWLAGALVGASALWGLYVAGNFLAVPALPVVMGQMVQQEYLNRNLPGLAPAIAFINRETPATAKVALFDEVRGFYLDREYVWATPNHAAGLLPWDKYTGVDDWLADFRRRGYTTLLVNRRNAPRPPDDQRWRSLLAQAASEGKITLAFSERGVDVYRIEEQTP